MKKQTLTIATTLPVNQKPFTPHGLLYRETAVLSDTAVAQFFCSLAGVSLEDVKRHILTEKMLSMAERCSKGHATVKEHGFVWRIVNGRIVSLALGGENRSKVKKLAA